MNIIQYMSNPMGKGSSALMLGAMRKELDQQYSDLHTKIELKWYAVDKKFLIAHVKVPSHSVEDLLYDVLIEIDVETIPSNISVINPAKVRVFSNCPSFVFTYAKVFQDNGDFIPWANGKYSKEVLKEEPEKRNPIKMVNYERSLYLAFRYILSNGRNYKAKVETNVHKVKSTKNILKEVKDLDDILKAYRSKKKKEDDKKKELSKPVARQEEKKTQAKPKSTNKKGVSKSTPKTKKVSSVTKTKKMKKL